MANKRARKDISKEYVLDKKGVKHLIIKKTGRLLICSDTVFGYTHPDIVKIVVEKEKAPEEGEK